MQDIDLITATIEALDRAVEYHVNAISGLPQYAEDEREHQASADAVIALQDQWREVAAHATDLATISFQPEAYDSAATAFLNLKGWSVRAVPVTGEPFDAEVADMIFDDRIGQGAVVVLHPWDETAGKGDASRAVTLDLYTELVRVEVI